MQIMSIWKDSRHLKFAWELSKYEQVLEGQKVEVLPNLGCISTIYVDLSIVFYNWTRRYLNRISRRRAERGLNGTA